MKSFTAKCMYQIGKVTSEKCPTVNITNEWKICVSEEREKNVIFIKPDMQELKGSYYQRFQVPVRKQEITRTNALTFLSMPYSSQMRAPN